MESRAANLGTDQKLTDSRSKFVFAPIPVTSFLQDIAMTSRFKVFACVALFVLAVSMPSARADLIITYDLNIVQTGPILLGDSVDWQIFATVSDDGGGPSVGTNNGIAAAAIDLQDSFGDTLNPGDVQNGPGEDFAGYIFPSGGVFIGGKLQNIGTFQDDQNSDSVGQPGDLGPHLLAIGTYTPTTLGLHTLSTVMSASTSQYWSDTGTPATATPFDQVAFGSDTILVIVPEPASLAMMGIAACGAWGLRRRRRAADRQTQSS